MGSNDQRKKKSMDQPMFGLIAPKDPATQSAVRNHMIAMTGEFVGTFMFLLLAFVGHTMAADQASATGSNGQNSNQTVIYISMAYGFSLLVTVWTLYRVSGGLFNPAVTVSMIITGSLPWFRGLLLIPVQIISGMCAAGIASAIVPGNIKTVQTTLAPGVSSAQGVFLEMFLTAQLCFTVLMLAAEKSKDTFIAPIGIGLALFSCEIAGVYYTGGSLNPARSFGPCVAGRNFQHYHWIYWIGPLLGALIAGGYFHFVKFFNYEEANPGQDSANGQFDRKVEEEAASPGADGRERDSMNMDSVMENGNNGQRNGGYHPGYAGERA